MHPHTNTLELGSGIHDFSDTLPADHPHIHTMIKSINPTKTRLEFQLFSSRNRRIIVTKIRVKNIFIKQNSLTNTHTHKPIHIYKSKTGFEMRTRSHTYFKTYTEANVTEIETAVKH